MSDEREMAVDKSSYFSHAFKYFLSKLKKSTEMPTDHSAQLNCFSLIEIFNTKKQFFYFVMRTKIFTR